jgi:hypothetical protein
MILIINKFYTFLEEKFFSFKFRNNKKKNIFKILNLVNKFDTFLFARKMSFLGKLINFFIVNKILGVPTCFRNY